MKLADSMNITLTRYKNAMWQAKIKMGQITLYVSRYDDDRWRMDAQFGPDYEILIPPGMEVSDELAEKLDKMVAALAAPTPHPTS